MTDRVVLAYSGGLDTTVAIPWLRETYGAEVVALLVDVGQPLGDVESALHRAKANGAEEARVVDAKEELATSYVLPALRANARYEGVYPLATALARPLIAEKLVELAHEVDADAVAHGCTAKGNDQVRFEVTINALDPALQVIAPARRWRPTRQEAVAFAEERGLQLPPLQKKTTYSVDENLWGRSVEAGNLEDPAVEVPEAAYAWTRGPGATPAEAGTVTIGFEAGNPVSLDGRPLDPVTLITELNALAGRHGVGRIDHVENRLVGIKSREVYEAPAANVLLQAHQALEALTLSRDVARFKPQMEQRYADLVYDGLWASPLRTAIQAFVDEVQADVSGQVTMKLHHGAAHLAGRSSDLSLYAPNLATYDEGDAFDHSAAEGFIALWGLPLRVAAARRRGNDA